MNVIIIGNGIAGISAALRLRELQPDWKITVVSGESTYHYSRPALMYIYMGHMSFQDTKPFPDAFWQEKRIDLVRAWVESIDFEGGRVNLHGPADALQYDKLLIATGSKSNRFGWKGQDLDGVQSLYGLQDLKLLHENTRDVREAVIVGGGLIGIEMAEMLHSRGIGVTFLVRESSYWNNILPEQESQLLNRVILEAGLGLKLETELTEIVDDGNGRCRAVRTQRDEELPCQVVGLTAGVGPNIDLVKDSVLETGRGILVDDQLRTSVQDVFAVGDCAEIVNVSGGRNTIQQVWYTGKMQGEVAADVMAGGERSYRPGIWFNSAKFLDMEYQTYGQVGLNVPNEKNLVWEHPEHKAIFRIVYTDECVIGLNFMGVRYRHEVCERWLRERRPLEYVLANLAEANFDPEFFKRFEREFAASCREQLR